MKDANERYEGVRYEKRDETSVSKKLGYVLIGGDIGAVLALLFAPKTGTELRGDIADVTRKGVEKGKETAQLVGEKAGDYYEVTRDKAGELYLTAQEKAGIIAERAKDAVSSTSNPFSAALDAGKEAYTEEKRRNEVKSIVEGRASYPIDEKFHDVPTEPVKALNDSKDDI